MAALVLRLVCTNTPTGAVKENPMNKFMIGAATAALLIGATGAMCQGFQMIDDGAGSRQVVADGPVTYVLKDTGNIWARENGQWTQVDDGGGTTLIDASAGNLYAQKNDGSVWQRKFGQWNRIGNPGTKQLVADSGVLYTLETNDDVLLFKDNQWTKLDNGSGSTMIAADRTAQNIQLFVLKNNGSIFHWTGYGMQWEVSDNGSGTKQIDASGGMLYALKDTGAIWRMNGAWAQIDDGAGTKQISADGRFFYALKDNGNIWMFRDERWLQADNGTGTRQLHASGGRLVVLKDNGNVFEADGNSLGNGAPGAPVNTQVANFNQLHND